MPAAPSCSTLCPEVALGDLGVWHCAGTLGARGPWRVPPPRAGAFVPPPELLVLAGCGPGVPGEGGGVPVGAPTAAPRVVTREHAAPACTHMRTRAHARAPADARAWARACTPMCVSTHSPRCARSCWRAPAHTRMLVHTHVRTCRTPLEVPVLLHTRTHVHARARHTHTPSSCPAWPQGAAHPRKMHPPEPRPGWQHPQDFGGPVVGAGV